MQKPTLLIIIDNLAKGGAEVLLVGILPELTENFYVVLVTLSGECQFDTESIICNQRYVLGFKDKLTFISAVVKLRRIIKRVSPAIVHAHLFYSSLAARIACPSDIPLLYSVHNELSKNIFNRNRLYSFLEGITIRKNHSIIAVSDLVLIDYLNSIRSTRKKFVLKNYIADQYFIDAAYKKTWNIGSPLKMVAVSNLKESKNYEYLIESFAYLKDHGVSLDIYGSYRHPVYTKLEGFVETNNLHVRFMGQVDNVWDKLPEYDVYIMSSKYEGFGIAAVEAMACGLPALLSDIPVLREVTQNTALFFDIKEPLSLSALVKEILMGKHDLERLSLAGKQVAKQYSRKKYIEELLLIYRDAVQ